MEKAKILRLLLTLSKNMESINQTGEKTYAGKDNGY